MTIKEAILKYPCVENGADFLEVVLTDRGIDGEREYTPADKGAVRLAVADIYSSIAALPDFSEYKLSVKYPRGWFITMARKYYNQNGEPNSADALKTSLHVPPGRFTVLW